MKFVVKISGPHTCSYFSAVRDSRVLIHRGPDLSNFEEGAEAPNDMPGGGGPTCADVAL